ncbi:AvrD family protein [Pseudosulfitobacter koreensis]|uniref:AvrD family protein n=1 Tax=Pseudosulfitobacter koreensis TaxID=2968472 RepID=A0ABT1Z4E4_9RHOB|nr:AvrD family protein [Pseudosulfitobacter koreense]MCR8828000.1 AvrD family protein [Pseudosulfitobacter koreense]
MELGYYKSIDDFLGVRQGRYFGDGYLKSSQIIRDFGISGSLNALQISCVGAVSLPAMWSQKGGTQQKPHLSTIDVIELALECLRQFRIGMRRGDELSTDLLSSISIVAGSSPVEEDMDALAITGQVLLDDEAGEVMLLNIANMEVHLRLRPRGHGVARGLTFCRQPVELSEVLLNTEGMQASAMASSGGQVGVGQSRAGQSGGAWSLSASFACALQLGQLLLYKLDKIDRTKSNTLWMKRTHISFSDLMPSGGGVQPIHAHLDDVLKYTKADGEWRRANVCAAFCNVQITCRVTHRLPGPAVHLVQ